MKSTVELGFPKSIKIAVAHATPNIYNLCVDAHLCVCVVI